jgi:hypothetical protein
MYDNRQDLEANMYLFIVALLQVYNFHFVESKHSSCHTPPFAKKSKPTKIVCTALLVPGEAIL